VRLSLGVRLSPADASLHLTLPRSECTLNTALYTCAKEGHQEIASRLLSAGADGCSHNSLALRWAAQGGHAPTVAVLVAGGADPDARNGEAIAMARLLGHASTVQVLMEHTQ